MLCLARGFADSFVMLILYNIVLFPVFPFLMILPLKTLTKVVVEKQFRICNISKDCTVLSRLYSHKQEINDQSHQERSSIFRVAPMFEVYIIPANGKKYLLVINVNLFRTPLVKCTTIGSCTLQLKFTRGFVKV